jgi:hypothetical protein
MFALTMACHALQVYGGAIGVIVGPYSRSFLGSGQSFASCANTTCTNCSVRISGTSITNSRALSNTSGNLAILVLAFALNYRQFLSKLISDAVDRQLLWGVCKSDRRRVQHTARLTFGSQVYGGSVAFVVQPYVWSSNSFIEKSSTSAGDTVVSGLSAVFLNCSFSGSTALTRTIGA